MKLVKATSVSIQKNIKIKELGRVANVGETFWVSDDRYVVLAGKNRYGLVFVTLIDSIPDTQPTDAAKTDEAFTDTTESEPDIILIEPGKKPVKVDKDLMPIEEELKPASEPAEEQPQQEQAEVQVEATPKKRRGRKKKSVKESSEE